MTHDSEDDYDDYGEDIVHDGDSGDDENDDEHEYMKIKITTKVMMMMMMMMTMMMVMMMMMMMMTLVMMMIMNIRSMPMMDTIISTSTVMTLIIVIMLSISVVQRFLAFRMFWGAVCVARRLRYSYSRIKCLTNKYMLGPRLQSLRNLLAFGGARLCSWHRNMYKTLMGKISVFQDI